MGLGGDAELFRIGVKKLLARCLLEDQFPSVSEIAILAYLLSPGRSIQKKEAGRETASQTVLFVLAELLKESFTNCATQLKAKAHSFVEADGNTDHSTLTWPPWSSLVGLDDGMTFPLRGGLTLLGFLSFHTSLITYVAMEIMASLNSDHTPVACGLGEVWRMFFRGFFEHCLSQFSTSEWHVLLVRLALCLLVKDMARIVTQWDQGCKGADSDKSVSQEMMEGRGLMEVWQFEHVLCPVVEGVAGSFSDLFHQQQMRYEREEAGQMEGCSIWRTGKQVLKSVHFLGNGIQVLREVARGCKKLEHKSAEYALRAATQSLVHLKKLSHTVGGAWHVRMCYHVLTSLDYLRTILLDLHLPQDMEPVRGEVCVRLEEELQHVSECVEKYHSGVCVRTLLQDGTSSGWTASNAFYEGQRCSWTTQMWSYYMRGLCYDLCTYLSESLCAMREGVLGVVLRTCLRVLVARYSHASSPLPPQHLSHFLADLTVILTCSNSLLPWLQGSSATPSVEVMGVHQSCGFLLAMGVVQSTTLQQLLRAVSQLNTSTLQKDREVGVWQQWVEQNLSHFTGKESDTPTMAVKSATLLPIKATPYLIKLLLPFTCPRSSDWGVMLQALLEDGAGLSVALCTSGTVTRPTVDTDPNHGPGGVLWSERSYDVLKVLSLCPHIQWALTAVLSALQFRAPDGCHDYSWPATSDQSEVDVAADPVARLLFEKLGPLLKRFLLEKTSVSLGQGGEGGGTEGERGVKDFTEELVGGTQHLNEWVWSGELLGGLVEALQSDISRPILLLLHWLATSGRRDNSASAGGRGHSAGGHGDLTLGQEEWHNIGDVIAKILSGVMSLIVKDLEPRPLQRSDHMTHLMHVHQLLVFALDPLATPTQLQGTSAGPFLSVSLLRQILKVQENKWACHRAQLGRVVEVHSSSRPLNSLEEELRNCVPEEHDLAAEIISSNEEGLYSLGVVRVTLKKWFGLSERSEFNPITEYANIQQLCGEWKVDHKKLAEVNGCLQDYNLLQSSLRFLIQQEGLCLSNVIRKWRWECHEPEELESRDQELVTELYSQLEHLMQQLRQETAP